MDRRADIYSLGVILHELLTDRLPEGRDDPPAFCPCIDGELADICWKCLAERPEDRYASAEELAADLEAWHEGKPFVRAHRYGPLAFSWKWTCWRPWSSVLLAACVAAVVLLVALWIDRNHRVEAAWQQEQLPRQAADRTAARERDLRQTATDALGNLLSFSVRRGATLRSRQELLDLGQPLLEHLRAADNSKGNCLAP